MAGLDVPGADLVCGLKARDDLARGEDLVLISTQN
jgi:hypothetical protein